MSRSQKPWDYRWMLTSPRGDKRPQGDSYPRCRRERATQGETYPPCVLQYLQNSPVLSAISQLCIEYDILRFRHKPKS
jgi:hypothetical protein